MPAILPLLLSIAPDLARWLFGARGEATVTLAAQAVQAATGTGDPDAARAALEADASKMTELRISLARIAADAEAAERKAALDELAERLADTADARRQTIALAQGGSNIAWAAPIVTAIVLVSFGAMLTLVLTAAIPEANKEIANIMLGTLGGMASTAVAYWLGSSAGSARKDEALRAAAQPPAAR